MHVEIITDNTFIHRKFSLIDKVIPTSKILYVMWHNQLYLMSKATEAGRCKIVVFIFPKVKLQKPELNSVCLTLL